MMIPLKDDNHLLQIRVVMIRWDEGVSMKVVVIRKRLLPASVVRQRHMGPRMRGCFAGAMSHEDEGMPWWETGSLPFLFALRYLGIEDYPPLRRPGC